MLVLIKANFGASPQLLSRHEELALLTPPPLQQNKKKEARRNSNGWKGNSKVRLDRQVSLSFASILAVAVLHKDVHT